LNEKEAGFAKQLKAVRDQLQEQLIAAEKLALQSTNSSKKGADLAASLAVLQKENDQVSTSHLLYGQNVSVIDFL
jgi:hypothetical protein